MTSQEQQIQELRDLVDTLQAENFHLKKQYRATTDIRDINDAASEMLRLGDQRYRTVFENSLLGNKIIGQDLNILQVNQSLVSLLGYSDKSDLVGRPILQFAHPDFTADWHILQEKLWNKRLPSFRLETCLLHKNGNGIWVNVTSMLFRDDTEYLGYTIIEDIRERKSGLDVLRLREEHLRSIIDIMPQQVWTAAPGGKLNFVNQQICSYFDRSAEDLITTGWEDCIHPDDVEKCRDAWSGSLKTGREYFIEYRLHNKKSDYKWYMGRAVPIRDDDGRITLWLGTNTDIDTQKANERQKDEFMSIASHELKTPLTSVKLYIQMARNASEEKRRDFIIKAAAPVERLERLINDLLDATRINAGKVTYDKALFEFDELLKETVSSFKLMNPSHQIQLAGVEPVQLTGDRHRIEQVLNNLLSNAVKYSPGADRVIVRSQVIADTVVVSVQDFGIGIPEKELTKLFDRYYRADNAAMKFDGLGLGLFISSEILKRHNGSLWIESEPGKGSIFYFLLPLNGQKLLTEIDTDHQTFYVANYLSVKYNPTAKWLEADWLGYQNLESVQKGCMIILDLLKKNHCTKVLNDNSKVMGNWSEAADWGASYWFPAMADAGLKKFAWIYSPSVFSRLAADKSLKSHSQDFETRFFADKDNAAAWLNNLKYSKQE